MRIVPVNPPVSSKQAYGERDISSADTYSLLLGLLSIVRCLRKHKHSFSIVDAPALRWILSATTNLIFGLNPVSGHAIITPYGQRKKTFACRGVNFRCPLTQLPCPGTAFVLGPDERQSGIRRKIRQEVPPGKSFESLAHLSDALLAWIANVADQRIHGTTHRRPAEMFEKGRGR